MWPGSRSVGIGSAVVVPASCFGDCFQDCISMGGMSKSGCTVLCNQECGGKPPDNPATGSGSGPPPGCSPLLPTGTGLPVYGNYCGPGFGDPTGRTPPVDSVDAVCRAHDMCYGATNMFNCGCDRALISSMPSAIATSPCISGKAAGAAAMRYFSTAPCFCNTRICTPVTGCATVLTPGRGGVGAC